MLQGCDSNANIEHWRHFDEHMFWHILKTNPDVVVTFGLQSSIKNFLFFCASRLEGSMYIQSKCVGTCFLRIQARLWRCVVMFLAPITLKLCARNLGQFRIHFTMDYRLESF